VEAFAARLRDQVDPDALEADLLGVVDQTVAPTRASLWLRPSAGGSQMLRGAPTGNGSARSRSSRL
jgi:hypothetical protein